MFQCLSDNRLLSTIEDRANKELDDDMFYNVGQLFTTTLQGCDYNINVYTSLIEKRHLLCARNGAYLDELALRRIYEKGLPFRLARLARRIWGQPENTDISITNTLE